VGYREAVSAYLPFRFTPPNAIDPVETFTAFLLSVVAGGTPRIVAFKNPIEISQLSLPLCA
jgi:hypothetical protein